MDIPWQTAESIINVEYNQRSRRDHLDTGIALLRRYHYAAARHELTKAIEGSPADETGHYYLALALLDGMRPNRCPRTVLDRVRRHLQTAATLPRARVLHLMVDEDDGLRWRYHTHIPQALFDLVALLENADVEELLTHAPAHGTRTYRVMEMALIGDEPNRS